VFRMRRSEDESQFLPGRRSLVIACPNRMVEVAVWAGMEFRSAVRAAKPKVLVEVDLLTSLRPRRVTASWVAIGGGGMGGVLCGATDLLCRDADGALECDDLRCRSERLKPSRGVRCEKRATPVARAEQPSRD
jgi:hypothetical protein